MRHPFAFVLSSLCLVLASPVWAQDITFAFTDLKNCPRDTSMDKDKDKDEEEGDDPPIICPGPGGGYTVMEYYSAYDIDRRISLKDDTHFNVFLRPSKEEDCPVVGSYGDKLEWRMKGGKPFAVIQRINCYALNENGTGPGKRLASYLIVKGLKGYESIDALVNTKTKSANEKARALADEGLRGR